MNRDPNPLKGNCQYLTGRVQARSDLTWLFDWH